MATMQLLGLLCIHLESVYYIKDLSIQPSTKTRYDPIIKNLKISGLKQQIYARANGQKNPLISLINNNFN